MENHQEGPRANRLNETHWERLVSDHKEGDAHTEHKHFWERGKNHQIRQEANVEKEDKRGR